MGSAGGSGWEEKVCFGMQVGEWRGVGAVKSISSLTCAGVKVGGAGLDRVTQGLELL
jgi:hypothetical protein